MQVSHSPVFEDEKVVLLGEITEILDERRAEILYNVDMGLQYTDVRAYCISKLDKNNKSYNAFYMTITIVLWTVVSLI